MNKYLVIEMHCPILAILYGTLLSVNEQMYVNVYIYIQSCRNPCEQESSVRFDLVNHHANIERLIY